MTEMIRGVLFLVFATLLWSSNYIVGRSLAPDMPALFLNGIRWVISAVEFGMLLLLTGQGFVLIKKWREFSLLGFVGIFIFSAFTYLGLKSVPASQAGMIAGLESVTMLLSAVIFLRERPRFMRWVGVIISVLGVFLLLQLGNTNGHLSVNLGDADLFVAALAWGVYSGLGSKLGSDLDSLTLTSGAAIYGAIPSGVAALYSLRTASFHMTREQWLVLIYISTAATVAAYFLWTIGVKRLGVSGSAPFLNLLPIWTVILGIAILREKVTILQYMSGAVILLGTWLAGDRATAWRLWRGLRTRN